MTRTVFRHVPVLLFVLLFGSTLAQGSAATADAEGLIRNAQRAVGAVVRTAKAEPKLDASKPGAKPFWNAMKELNEALDKAQTGLTLKDNTFFSNLAAARAQVAQAEIAVEMSGANNPKLSGEVQTLSGLVTTLDENYSKEAGRLKQGGPLTAEERKQLDELKKQQDKLMAKLDQVERNAAKNNKAMQQGIDKIREESNKIRKARNTTAGFVGGFLAARLMSGWMWGWHWWWGPWGAWCPGWIDINIIIWDGWIDVVPYDWALADAAVDIGPWDLDSLDFSDPDLEAADAYLIDNEFDLDDDDLRAMTSELDLGWDDVQGDTGMAIMDQVESNFDAVPFEPGFEVDTFEDYGIDDFGGDFGGDFGEFDFDW